MFKKFLGILVLLVFNIGISAEETKTEKEVAKEIPKEEFVETQHEIKIKGLKLNYKAVAGTLNIKKDEGSPEASIFYVSYTKDGVTSKKDRPITFCFNGGPGSASVWLHLGVFGPKRVQVNDKVDALPPYQWIENEFTLLEESDLVFIDPVSTGFSRAIAPTEAKQFNGYKEDIKALAEFIRLYLTKNSRWDSPKFLAGESYGTARAIGLAGYLYDESYIYINGIVLISACLDFQCLSFDTCNDHAFATFLPSYTAVAWYHGRLDPDLQKDLHMTLNLSKEFVYNQYVGALLKGNQLTPDERKSTIHQLARFTSLSPEYIDKSDLRLEMSDFSAELLKDKKEIVGRFDGRVKGANIDPLNSSCSDDPSFDNVLGVFTGALNQYVREELKWPKEEKYKILADVHPWNYSTSEHNNQYLNVTDTLRGIIARNPKFKVFVASGYYDLATPYFGTECSINRLGLDKKFYNQVSMQYYDAGHMMYLHDPSLEKLKKDLSNYYKATLNPGRQ